MFRFLHRRSIIVDMGLVFGAILAMGVVAGLTVWRTNAQLVSDARDAVWEASVPPSQVFAVITAQWAIHEHVTAAALSRASVAATQAKVQDYVTRTDTEWQAVLGLSPYFPADVKTEIDRTNALLEAFRKAYADTLTATANKAGSDAQLAAIERQSTAMRALAGQVALLLDTMKARIDHVNQRMENTSAAGLIHLSWVGLAVFGLVMACGIVVLLRIVRPIRELTRVLGALAAHDLSVEIPAPGRGEEIDRMSATVAVFKATALETDALRSQQERQREQAAAERRMAMLDLAQRFEHTVGGIIQAVTQSAGKLETSAETMSRSAEVTAARSTAVAEDSGEATRNVRHAAESTAQLSEMMTGVGAQTEAATSRIAAAAERARATNADVQRLGQAADAIGNVVSLIASIANQTNLLALNATIEAARAGDYGRGFAIVASEVKQLATETARATEEITSQIGAMQTATSASIDSIRGIATIIAEVSDIARNIGAAIEAQVLATGEISSSVSKAAARTQTVTQNIAEVNAGVQGSDRIAGDVLGAARDLSRNGTTLMREVEGFLTSVRAA